jgi:hypothetical protein
MAAVAPFFAMHATANWVQLFGTSFSDSASGVVAHDGAVFITIDTSEALLGTSPLGLQDGLVVRVNASDGAVLWATRVGGSDTDSLAAIAAEGDAVFVAGVTRSSLPGFPAAGEGDALVAKLHVNGTLLFAQTLASSADESFTAVATLAATQLFLVGSTLGNLSQPAAPAAREVLVVAYSLEGGAPSWVRGIDGPGSDIGLAVAASGSGVYVAGSTSSPLLLGHATHGLLDAFLARLSVTDGSVVWLRIIGSAAVDRALSVAIASGGTLVLAAGETRGTLEGQAPVQGADAFVAFVEAANGTLARTAVIASAGNEGVSALVVQGTGVYAFGVTNGVFVPGTAALGNDTFVAKLSDSGDREWIKVFASPGNEALGGAAGATGALFFVGSSTGAFPNTLQSNAGEEDAFLARLGCPPGLSPALDWHACGTCAAGFFCPDSLVSVPCAAGLFSLEDATVCTNCSVGRFSSGAAATQCSACGAGSFAPAPGASACSLCQSGRFSNASNGAEQCTACVEGRFATGSGSSVCALCPAGKFSNVSGALLCRDCPAGTFNAAQGATSGSACSFCGLGSVPAAGGASCAPCPGGSYNAVPGAATCTPCAAGTAAAMATGGQTSADVCVPCPAGRWQNASGAVFCHACPAGRFGNASAQTNESISCFLCPAGTITGTFGLSSCSACAAGRFSNSSGASFCFQCQPGSYGDRVAATSAQACVACPPGTFSGTTPSGSCASCPGGRFSAASGQSSATTCATCTEGRFSAATNPTTCEPCGVGRFASATGQDTCEACPAGRTTATPGATSLDACEESANAGDSEGSTLIGLSQAAGAAVLAAAGVAALALFVIAIVLLRRWHLKSASPGRRSAHELARLSISHSTSALNPVPQESAADPTRASSN